MHRTFKTSSLRQQTYLEGYWDFIVDPNDRGLDEGWYEHFPAGSQQVWVPGVWNTLRNYLNYEGVAWYHSSLSISECGAAVIQFAAVTHQANIWLDGEPLGEHYGSFLPFRFLLVQPEAGVHDLIVRIDNTHDMTSTIPSAILDWFRYGGIPRPVWLEQLAGPGYIANFKLFPTYTGSRCVLRVNADVFNLTDQVIDQAWELWVDNRLVAGDTVHVLPQDTLPVSTTITLPQGRLWSPNEPNLYQVRLQFAHDDLIDRIGFHQLELAGRQILLNGTPLQISGVNRHEDHPEWGFAIPEHLTLRDLELVNDLHVNSIRTAHYPCDQRLLDLCDERGILTIEEIPLSHFGADQLAIDIIADRASAMLWGTINRDINHPCIWAWSLLNECDTTSVEGRNVVEQLANTAREADPSRPITYATNQALRDICFDLVDFVTVNAFFGWYSYDFTWPAFLDRLRSKIGDKPLLLGEFGAEGLYGFRALEEDVMWSEEYQRKVVCECVKHLKQRDDLLGFYVWQFCDSRTDGGIHALGRPRTYNNKGLLDEYRRPKLVYYALRELLSPSGPQQIKLM
jgi:beta-glucuronidase